METQKKLDILDKSNSRLKKIVTESKNEKFNCLHDWEDFQSKSFRKENEGHIPKFKKYRRGTIIFVNFGISIGTELSGNHFAIVLSKDDNPLSGVITVLPLTSKDKRYYLPFETELIQRILEDLAIQIEQLSNVVTNLSNQTFNKNTKTENANSERLLIIDKDITKYISSYSEKSMNDDGILHIGQTELIHLTTQNIDFIEKVINYYTKYNKSSFGMIGSITTISKYRIKKPLNNIDPIGKITVSNQILGKIDKSFINCFTYNSNKNKSE